MKPRTIKQEYPRHKDKAGTYVEMYGTIWEPEPGVLINIAAPNIAKLHSAWKRIEPNLVMNEVHVNRLKVYAHDRDIDRKARVKKS